jgi:plasmid stability protein
MGDLLIRDFPAFVKNRIAAAAKEAGHSISEEAKLRLVQSVVDDETGTRKPKSAYDEIRGAFLEHDAILSDEEHSEFMRAVDEMRKDMGSPAPDFE